MSGLDLRPYQDFHGSAQQKLATAQRLQAAIREARAQGRTEDLQKLEALAAQMEPALWQLNREINQTRKRLARDVLSAANAATLDEIKRLQDRKARRMKRSWRR